MMCHTSVRFLGNLVGVDHPKVEQIGAKKRLRYVFPRRVLIES